MVQIGEGNAQQTLWQNICTIVLCIVESLISKIIKPTFHFELSIYNFGSKYLDSR